MGNSLGSSKKGKAKRAAASRYDWDALKLEFLQGNESLNEFRLRHKLNKNNFYGRAGAWPDERAAVRAKALGQVQEKMSDKLAHHWEQYTRLFDAIKVHAAMILQSKKNEKGEPVPMDPLDLSRVASSLESALKGDRLIYGEPTEITKETGFPNVHIQTVQLLEAIERGEVLRGEK